MEALLLSRHMPLYEFKVEKNEISEIIPASLTVDDIKAPITDLLKSIFPASNRESLWGIYDELGIDSLEDLIRETHCVSLSNDFWIKDMWEKVSWKDVSLFDKPCNNYLFEKDLLLDTDVEKDLSPSAQPMLDGQFSKGWLKEKDGWYLYKTGTEGFCNSGKEPYSEFLACQLAEALELPHVDYDIVCYENRLCSKCKIFTNDKVAYVPMKYLIDREIQDLSDVREIIQHYADTDDFDDMVVFDSLIFNSDRHLGNFGILMNNMGFKSMGMAPLFDHNLSLLCYGLDNELESEEKLHDYMRHTCTDHSLSRGVFFIDEGKQYLTSRMKKKLENIRDFEFKNHEVYPMSEDRLKSLTKIVRNNIKEILE